MPHAPEPQTEVLRQLVLDECALADAAPDPVFDAVVALAASLCDVPIALISLIDRGRQVFKARRGLTVTETPREHAFCAHAVAATETLVVEDATADPRFRENPLVTGEPGIRFYAGVPIIVGEDRQAIGTVCVIDRYPRRLTDGQVQGLHRIAALTAALATERRAARMALDRAEQASEQLRRMALTDSVTGALNRRGFLDQARWASTGGGSVLLVEINDLDRLRNQNGLTAAESVARTCITLAGRVAGRSAVVGRLTASTSAVLLPEMELDAARAVAERLRSLVETSSAQMGQAFTVAVGVAPVAVSGAIEGALAAADTALTEARRLGGNAVVTCARTPARPVS